jgi:mono/diheme cytochrome c family protein
MRRRAVVGLALVALAGCGGGDPEVEEIGFDTDGDQGTATFSPQEEQGDAGPPRVENPQAQRGSARSVFTHTCGTCHTLEAAGTDSRIGPDLDRLRPTAAQVRAAIENGAGNIMPANLLVPRDARRVARFVAEATR